MQLQKISYILIALFVACLMTRGVANAVAPEGFEVFALRDKIEPDMSIKYRFTDTIWDKPYQSIQFFITLPTKTVEPNFWTFGGMYQTTHERGNRDAYFVRYDLVFLEKNSLSIKWMHDDYIPAKTGTETLALEFNTYAGEQSGVFFNAGYYHKWFKHQWDKNWQMPLDFGTNDERGFVSAQLGWKNMLNRRNFWTFDFNIRDPFGYHVVDLVGLDFTLNFTSSSDQTLQILIGYRYSAVWVGTADLAQFHTSLGYSF